MPTVLCDRTYLGTSAASQRVTGGKGLISTCPHHDHSMQAADRSQGLAVSSQCWTSCSPHLPVLLTLLSCGVFRKLWFKVRTALDWWKPPGCKLDVAVTTLDQPWEWFLIAIHRFIIQQQNCSGWKELQDHQVQPSTSITKPCPQVPHPHVFWIFPGTVTPPLPWLTCSSAWQPFP